MEKHAKNPVTFTEQYEYHFKEDEEWSSLVLKSLENEIRVGWKMAKTVADSNVIFEQTILGSVIIWQRGNRITGVCRPQLARDG